MADQKLTTTSDAPAQDANHGVVNDGTPRPAGGGDSQGGGGSDDRVHSPQVSVEGGKCTIRNFDLLRCAVAFGQTEDVGNMTSFPPAAVKTLVITAPDHGARITLAAALEAIAGQLRGG